MAASPPRPLAEHDNRKSFDCGRESLNNWFHRHAWSNHVNGSSRVNVIEDAVSGRIIGYVALSSSQIERALLPKPQQRNRRPRTGNVAAFRASAEVGSFRVITHPLDDGVRRYFARWGFDDLPLDPRRAMIVRMVDLGNMGE